MTATAANLLLDNDAHRACHALFVDLRGGRQPACRGARRASDREGTRRSRPRALGPAGPPQPYAPPRRRPARPPMPDYLIPLGRTVGFAANGAVSNLSAFPDAIARMRRELRDGHFDVVHVHEPPAPTLGWDATGFPGAPGRRHLPRLLDRRRPQRIAIGLGARRRFNQLSARIAVSEAAAWTGRRWFGGDYEIIPNGVDIELSAEGAVEGADTDGAAAPVRRPGRGAQGPAGPAARLRGAGRARPRPARGRRRRSRGRRPLPRRPRGARAHRRARRRLPRPPLGGARRRRRALRAVARRRELRHGPDRGVRRRHAGRRLRDRRLPRRRRATASTASWSRPAIPSASPRSCSASTSSPTAAPRWARPPARAPSGTPGRGSPTRSNASTSGRSTCPQPVDRLTGSPSATASPPPTGCRGCPAMRIPSPEPIPVDTTSRRRRIARRIGVGAGAAVGIGLTFLAAQRIGFDQVVESAVRSDLAWVLIAPALHVPVDVLPRRRLVPGGSRGAARSRRCAAATSPRRR